MPEDPNPVTSLLRAAGMLSVPEFPLNGKPPEGLCPEHARIWRSWWDYARSYDPRHPKDFGNMGPIMDNRTSHAERRADWLRKGVVQLDLTVKICRHGSSPQCGPRKDARR